MPEACPPVGHPFAQWTVQGLVNEVARDPWLAGALAAYGFAAALAQGRRVLDAGCEYGLGTYLLAQEAAEVVALDSNAETLDVARRLLGNCRNVTFQASRVEQFSPSAPFALVCAFDLLHLVPQPQAAFSAVRSLVAAEGEALFTFPEREEELSAALAACFPRTSCRTVSGGEGTRERRRRVWVASQA